MSDTGTSSCPTQEELEALAAGRDVSAEVAAHVARCPRCAERISLARFELRFERVMAGDIEQDVGVYAQYPEIFGYSIVGVIARGGQGVVYGAVQDTTGQQVAIKVIDLSRGCFSKQARERMSREVQIIASLNHPGIVRVIDSIRLMDGREALVMEHIEGEELSSWLANNPGRTESELLELLAGIADAIHHAHQRGIIHRDLKPSNILVDDHGRARVLDFGVARWTDLLDEDAPITRTGEFAGTLGYAAPEQVGSDSSSPDIRTDVYALGVIGFEMLTGEALIPRDSSLQSMIQKILTSEPPKRSLTGLRFDTWTVLSKAMAKEKHRRYQSAAELSEDLRRAARGEAIRALGDSRWYVLRKGIVRHRVALSFSLMMFLAIAGVLLSLAIGNAQLSRALRESRILQIRAQLSAGNRELAERVLLTEYWRTIDRHIDATEAIWNAKTTELKLLWCFIQMQSQATCLHVAPHALDPKYRLWALDDGRFMGVNPEGMIVAISVTVSGVNTEPYCVIPDGAETLKITPNGRYALCLSDDEIWCVDLETQHRISSSDLGGYRLAQLEVTFSDWGVLIMEPSGRLRVLSIPALEVIEERTGLEIMQSPWIDPLQRTIAYIDNESTLRVVDLQSKREKHPSGVRLSGFGRTESLPQILLSPEMDRVVVAYGGGLLVIDSGGGVQLPPILDQPGYRVWVHHDPSWSLLTASANGDPVLHLWGTESWESLPGLPGHARTVVAHEFTRDSTKIVTLDIEGTLRVWASPKHSWRESFGDPSTLSHQIAISPSLDRLYAPSPSGDLSSFVLSDAGFTTPQITLVEGYEATRVSVDHSGDRLAIAGLDRSLEVLEIQSGKCTHPTLPPGAESIAGIVFHPRMDQLAVCVNPCGIVLIDAITGRTDRVIDVPSDALASSIAWSADTMTIAVSLRDGTLAVVEDPAAGEAKIIDLHATHLRSLAFWPGGDQLVTLGETGSLYLVDMRTGKVRVSERLSEHSLFSVAVHPGGRIVMVGDRAGNIKAVDLGSMSELTAFDAGGSVMWMEFVGEGNDLMVAALDRPVEVWRFGTLAKTISEITATR